MSSIIEAHGLVKRYGEVTALAGLDLTVSEGTIVGLLGPNGAGKTTAVSILTTLIEPDEGTATVAGIDVRKHPDEVRRRIGLSGQYAAVDETLTGFENLDMIGRLSRLSRQDAKRRAGELLERFDLTDAADRPVKTYSGGMRRRLDLAGALVAEAAVLFLDEPTTGLDPRSRIELWGVIQDLVSQGATLLLTTQYLEEADRLADDIVVIDQGKEIAHGTSDELKATIGGERIELVVDHTADIAKAVELLTPLAVGEIRTDDRTRSIVVPVSGGAAALTQSLRAMDGGEIALSDVGLRRPTLDDVFLSLTGHRTDDGSELQEVPT